MGVTKFHLSLDGVPRPCGALVRCPLATAHGEFSSVEEAWAWAERLNGAAVGLSLGEGTDAAVPEAGTQPSSVAPSVPPSEAEVSAKLEALRGLRAGGHAVAEEAFGQAVLAGLDVAPEEAARWGLPASGAVRLMGADERQALARAFRGVLNPAWDRARVAMEGSMTPGELEAVRSYTGATYRTVNEAFWNGEGLTSPSLGREVPRYDQGVHFSTYGDLVGLLDSFLGRPPAQESRMAPTVVYRGVTFREELSSDTSLEELARWGAAKFPVGGAVEFPSYTSTSLDPLIAHEFGEHGDEVTVMFEMAAWSGRYVDHVSNCYGEFEHLLPRGTRFEVVGLELGKVGVTQATGDGEVDSERVLLVKLVELVPTVEDRSGPVSLES